MYRIAGQNLVWWGTLRVDCNRVISRWSTAKSQWSTQKSLCQNLLSTRPQVISLIGNSGCLKSKFANSNLCSTESVYLFLTQCWCSQNVFKKCIYLQILRLVNTFWLLNMESEMHVFKVDVILIGKLWFE